MRDGRVWHSGHQHDVHGPTRFGPFSKDPLIVVCLLCCEFAFVQLPVLIDSDRFSSVGQGLNMRDERFSSGLDLSSNILSSIGCVVLVLFYKSDCWKSSAPRLTYHDFYAFLVPRGAPLDNFVAGGLELGYRFI